MDKGRAFLGDLVYYRTYAKTLSDGYKESWSDCVSRNKEMYLKKFPHLRQQIEAAYAPVYDKRVLPSMRSLQFAGEAIERSNVRAFNCSFLHIDNFKSFAELFWVLMNGTGVGYSVQANHICKLPPVPYRINGFFQIQDTKESWADSIYMLCQDPGIKFDYSAIRPKDAPISTGGYASGPESLEQTHEKIRRILQDAEGRRLTSIECHDICCIIADVVVVGSVRRAALIVLFDAWDQDMLAAKAGEWWLNHPYRARANNSAVICRTDPLADYHYKNVMAACKASGSGEPGISWTNNPDLGFNPCHEIALHSMQFCNLTEINTSLVFSKGDFTETLKSAIFLGALQASLTDFPYLRPEWKLNSDREALLGVSLTGQAENWARLERLLPAVSGLIRPMADSACQDVGIALSARITCVKPSGSASTLLGTTAGIHAAHDQHYIRRVRVEKIHPLASILKEQLGEFIEQDKFVSDNIVVSVPCAFSGKTITRDSESALDLLERVLYISDNWVVPGHGYGDNTHNVSCTLSVKDEEWPELSQKMWKTKDRYAGLSILPYDGGTYVQAPYESIDHKKYTQLAAKFPWDKIDLTKANYKGYKEDQKQELACHSGACDIT